MQGQLVVDATRDAPVDALVTHDTANTSTLETFLLRVIYDGRFLSTVNENPRAVAESLMLELSNDDEASLKSSTLSDTVGLVYKKVAFGPIAIIGVCILIGIVVVVAWKYSTKVGASAVKPVIDRSAHASLKL